MIFITSFLGLIESKLLPLKRKHNQKTEFLSSTRKYWFKILAITIFVISFGLILKRNLPGILSTSAPDFTQVLTSAKAMLKTNDPYFNSNLDYPNAYPPISELFFLPLALLTYQQALAVFTFFSFASIIGSVFLSLKLVAKKTPWHYFLLFIALSLFSFPTKFSLGMGQINMIVLFFMLLSIYLETKTKKNSVVAGISLGIAIALKPIFAFFLLFLIIKRSWKLVFASIFTILSLTVVTLFLWPFIYWIGWYKSGILPLTNYTSPQIYVYPNQGVFGFIYRSVSNPSVRIYLHKIITFFLITFTTHLIVKNKNYNLGLSLFIITLLIFDLTSWQHHYVWLIFTFIVLVYDTIKTKNAILLGLICVAYLLVSWNFKQPSLYPTIILSTQFYGAIILWFINLFLLKTNYSNIKSTKNNFFKFLEFDD